MTETRNGAVVSLIRMLWNAHCETHVVKLIFCIKFNYLKHTATLVLMATKDICSLALRIRMSHYITDSYITINLKVTK